jgi:hypothetical protein
MLALAAGRGRRNAPGRQARACLRTAEAEASRLTGPGDPGLWRAAVEAWERVPAAHRVAYARLRLAEALLARRGQRQQAQAELAAAREIAARLGARTLAEEAAGLHVSHILAKLGVATRGEAAALAHRLELGRAP